MRPVPPDIRKLTIGLWLWPRWDRTVCTWVIRVLAHLELARSATTKRSVGVGVGVLV